MANVRVGAISRGWASGNVGSEVEGVRSYVSEV